MRILILGGDGYLGWPTAMFFAAHGHEVWVVDNYLRRNIARETLSEALMSAPNLHDRADIFHAITQKSIKVMIGDCTDYGFMAQVYKDFIPEATVHYAEQPSAPYSMIGYHEAQITFTNNLNSTFNMIWAAKEFAPDCHIVKLGTMGEYGTPNIDIEEGWIEIEKNGRKDTFLFPRQAGSLYHTTKVLDTDLLWFYTRAYGIRVTDLMQGPVYGLTTAESNFDERLMPNFHYDDIFGTVVNRFLVQAVAGVPLTVYGKGGQTRGYLNIIDTLNCVELAVLNPAKPGELKIFNQFTELITINDLASKVQRVGDELGLNVKIEHIINPREEKEEHYYVAKHSGLLDLGLKPHFMSDEVIMEMLKKVIKYKGNIDRRKIMPRVKWR